MGATASTADIAPGTRCTYSTSSSFLAKRIAMESEKAKEHRKAKQREYYLLHREEILARNKAYRMAHPEKLKEYQKNAAVKRKANIGYYAKYYQRNKAKLNAYAVEWRKKHPEKAKAYTRKYREKMREIKNKRKRWNATDTDKAKSLFLDPKTAAHFQWLVDHAKEKDLKSAQL